MRIFETGEHALVSNLPMVCVCVCCSLVGLNQMQLTAWHFDFYDSNFGKIVKYLQFMFYYS